MIAVRFMLQEQYAQNQMIPINVHSQEDAENEVQRLIDEEDPRIPLKYDDIRYFRID
jgi:antitoxin component of RelBE/YafQ-DinJ toxin-antitoxin module